jgi:CubicO group peptidase (beta-lactamase class C family)
VGFGLGFGVVIDPVLSRVVRSEGELAWGGAASTAFWVDQREELAVAFYTQLLPSSTYRIGPQLRTAFWVDQREELAVAFYTQLLPSSTYRIGPQLRQLVYQALTG